MDNSQQDLAQAERAIIREYSWLAGYRACTDAPISNTALHRRAIRFMAASALLAPHIHYQPICGLVIKHFAEGWRQAEQERPQPSEGR